MSDGRFKLAQVWLGRIYPIGLGYICLWMGATLLDPNEDRIYLTRGLICPTWIVCHGSKTRQGTGHVQLVRHILFGVKYVRPCLTVMVLEPDPGPNKSDTSNMSEMGSDISDQEAVPWFWNLMEISNLVRYI
jgi:hypothetical protein